MLLYLRACAMLLSDICSIGLQLLRIEICQINDQGCCMTGDHKAKLREKWKKTPNLAQNRSGWLHSLFHFSLLDWSIISIKMILGNYWVSHTLSYWLYDFCNESHFITQRLCLTELQSITLWRSQAQRKNIPGSHSRGNVIERVPFICKQCYIPPWLFLTYRFFWTYLWKC